MKKRDRLIFTSTRLESHERTISALGHVNSLKMPIRGSPLSLTGIETEKQRSPTFHVATFNPSAFVNNEKQKAKNKCSCVSFICC